LPGRPPRDRGGRPRDAPTTGGPARPPTARSHRGGR
jgi:hypothetical protein